MVVLVLSQLTTVHQPQPSALYCSGGRTRCEWQNKKGRTSQGSTVQHVTEGRKRTVQTCCLHFGRSRYPKVHFRKFRFSAPEAAAEGTADAVGPCFAREPVPTGSSVVGTFGTGSAEGQTLQNTPFTRVQTLYSHNHEPPPVRWGRCHHKVLWLKGGGGVTTGSFRGGGNGCASQRARSTDGTERLQCVLGEMANC